MGVIVDFLFMGRVDMVVRTMVAGVIMVMKQRVSMIVAMFVFVVMLVAMGMNVLVRVFHVSVNVFVSMRVAVLVGVQMLVFVVAVHGGSFRARLPFGGRTASEISVRRCTNIVNDVVWLAHAWHKEHTSRAEVPGACHELKGRTHFGRNGAPNAVARSRPRLGRGAAGQAVQWSFPEPLMNASVIR